MSERGKLASTAQEKVNESRMQGNPAYLADSLEALAAALLKEGDILAAAVALEEAAELWSNLHLGERQGSCLLLATSSRRLAGDLDGAKRNLVIAMAEELPKKIKNGFDVEWCEQELANGRCNNAYDGFTRILGQLAEESDSFLEAQLYQRRAVAAMACQWWVEAAEDFLHTSTIFQQHGFHADAEASALAAASALITVHPDSAERIVSELYKTVPADGASATRRGLVGGKVAMKIGNAALALKRFDEARQGALDVVDAVSYLAAAISASNAAEYMGDFKTAYARLATAWASLSDLLDANAAAQMIQPELEGLQERLGTDDFTAAKHQYEKKRLSMRTQKKK